MEDGYSQDRLLTDLRVGASAVPWLVETDYHYSGNSEERTRVAQRTHYETRTAGEAYRLGCFGALLRCHTGNGISERRTVTSRRPIPRTSAALILFACIAGAQTAVTPPLPTQSTVVRLTNAPSDRALKEVATLLRTVTGSPYLSSNIAQSTIAITGTPEQLALAEWLSKVVDKPAGWRPSDSEYGNPTAREYKLPSARDELAGVFYLRDTATPQAMQEILTVLRTVADVQKLFFRSEPKMIAYRADPSQANLIEWLLPKLDSPSGDLSHYERYVHQDADSGPGWQ
jgi:hypothetical protein